MGLKTVTTISESDKSKISLVSIDDTAEFRILKQYKDTKMRNVIERIRDLNSTFFPKMEKIWIEEDELFVLEEHLEGETLDIYMTSHELSREEIIELLTGVCKAVQVLHSQQPPIIHRDIKPQNIIVDDKKNIHIIDFDSAREFGRDKSSDTVLLGTKEYAAPEQFGYSQTDRRSDIYSIGIVFSELLGTGKYDDDFEKNAKRIISIATRFDPKERYNKVEDLLSDIERLRDKRKSRYWVYGFCSAVLVGILLFVISSLIHGNNAKQQQGEPGNTATGEAFPSTTQAAPSPTSQPSSTPTATPLPTATPTPQYESVFDEFRAKRKDMDENGSILYSFMEPEDHSKYTYFSANQETCMGRDFPVCRFFKANPRDLIFTNIDYRHIDDFEISVASYDVETGTKGEYEVIDRNLWDFNGGDIIRISREAFKEMPAGCYYLNVTGFMNDGGSRFEFYFVIHSEDDNLPYRAKLLTEINYFSEEHGNDISFYVNNTIYGISKVMLDKTELPETAYELIEAGYGIKLYADYLRTIEDKQYQDITLVLSTGEQVVARIIFLKQFKESD